MKEALHLFFLIFLLRCTTIQAGEDDVNCYRPPILAPFQDCKDVVIAMDRAFGVERDPDRDRSWGRSVNESDRNHVKLPIGFKLVQSFGQKEVKKCEIHVDNEVGLEDRIGNFPAKDVTWAAYNILNFCYPYGLTGKVWMGGRRTIYVTTIYTSWPYGDPRQIKQTGDVEMSHEDTNSSMVTTLHDLT